MRLSIAVVCSLAGALIPCGCSKYGPRSEYGERSEVVKRYRAAGGPDLTDGGTAGAEWLAKNRPALAQVAGACGSKVIMPPNSEWQDTLEGKICKSAFVAGETVAIGDRVHDNSYDHRTIDQITRDARRKPAAK
jgi:hypothetical protein